MTRHNGRPAQCAGAACKAAVAALVLFIACVQPASAAFPGENGRIAFQHRANGFGIWTMNADGTDRRQLTQFGSDPRWSPDGTRILFWEGGPRVMNADGTGLQEIRDYGLYPSWSPDGSKIVFTQWIADGEGLYTMNADGSDVTRLTAGHDLEAVWSPDGEWIAFTRGDAGFTLYLMRPDGSALRPLLGGIDGDPDWSPDSRSIAVDVGAEIWIYELAGATVRRTQASLAADPGWSPDGSQIVYSGPGRDNRADLFAMRADGTTPVQLTDTIDSTPGAEESGADWQPIVNRAPDCSTVTASPDSLLPANRRFATVRLSGAIDPDGDAVQLTILGVTQDEPVRGRGDPTAPDARLGAVPDEVDLRAERAPRGDGRVYRIAFEASDGEGGTCTGAARIEVRRHRSRAAVESPEEYDSLARR